MVSTLVLIYYGRPQLKETIKTYLLTHLYPKVFLVLFFIKRSGMSISTIICVWFSNKSIFMFCSIEWPNFIVSLRYFEIFYCTYLLYSLWRQKKLKLTLALQKFLCNNKLVIKWTYDAVSFSFFIFIYHIIYN